jgi:tRNA(fMet)-specific endonuclease VapC
MTHVLDTDHLSIWQRGSGADYAVLLANLARHPGEDVGLSVVSIQEQVLGWNAYVSRSRTPADLLHGYDQMYRVMNDFRTFPLVPFDAAALAAYDSFKPYKLRVGTMDLRSRRSRWRTI